MKAEPSKWLPIVLSVVAIGISCLSWWESHQTRTINEEVNRPVLKLTELDSVRLDLVQASEGMRFVFSKDAIRIKFIVKLQNIGKSTAGVYNLSVEPRLTQPTDKTCKITPIVTFDEFLDSDVLAGSEASVTHVFGVSPGCDKFPELDFDVRLLVLYTDSVAERQYVQQFRASSVLRTSARPVQN